MEASQIPPSQLSPLTTDGSAPPEQPPVEFPKLPHLEILGEIGRGGMGVVYKATHKDTGRLIALKMIRDGALASPQQLARFRIEAEAAARMRHDNIVHIEEIGEHQGRPYFVMELIEGGRLDQRLSGQPQPATESAVLLRTIARAVQHAHEQKIVHRDLKPANILLQEAASSQHPVASRQSQDATGYWLLATDYSPKITDFGLAKRLDSESTAWTPEGAIVGTPTYMAPEQALGRVNEIGPGVDVYALGVILYEMLTGRPPFQADNWTLALEQVIHEEPLPPTRLKSDVPLDLETVCLKCLEKEPRNRYPSAGDLADDLERFLKRKPIAAVPLSAFERLVRLAARDGYKILGEVGRGPRAAVYRARHDQFTQTIALKVFAPGTVTGEEWQTRLEQGLTLLAAVNHPQVVPVHRGGWLDGHPYIAGEYVPQGSLAARLSGRPLSIRQGLGLVEQLGVILSYCHRQGIIHGNLKPSNILMAANGIPLLTDFCVIGGSHLEPPAKESAALAYVAPEMIANANAEPRYDTDVYSLGIILYELLTGQVPFKGANAAEVLDQIHTREPLPPSAINADVTPQVDRTCMRCLQKNRWLRYTRTYDLSMRLRRLLEEL